MSSNADKGDQFTIPDEQTLSEAAELPILDQDGTSTPFKHLSSPGDAKRHLLVFIRHFYCGHCEDYVRALSTHLPPSTISTTTPPTDITIIGCGDPIVIADYIKRTACAFPIYTDPHQALYVKLGMVSNTQLGDKRPEYVGSSVVAGTLGSMWNMIKSGGKIWKGGAFDQNGGEWLFEADGRLRWCRRMRNTRDHAEIGEVVKVLGLKDEGAGNE